MTSTFCLLESKTVLSIEGKDRVSFLQGLVTQDVTKVTSKRSFYSLLLSPQGKFLYDFFIFPGNTENTKLFLVGEKKRAQDLLKRLSLYKLRSDVTLSLPEDLFVFAWWGDKEIKNLSSKKGTTVFQENILIVRDPRLELLGGLLVCSSEKEGKDFLRAGGFEENKEEAYRLHLLQAGVPNGSQDMMADKAIPLECGMEELGAIDWEKGCYLGQELTARTRYRGEVRKRLLPGILEGVAEVPFKSRLFLEEKEVGTMRSSMQGYGLALIRLEALEKEVSQTFFLYPPQEEEKNIKTGTCLGKFKVYSASWMQLSSQPLA